MKIYSKDFSTFFGTLDTTIEAFVEEERNGLFELRFICLNTDSLFNYIEKDNIVVSNANDTLLNQKFRIYMTRKMMNNRVEVFARHISFDLMYDYVSEVSFENQSAEYALNQLFRQSNFSTHYKGYSDIINAQKYSMSMCNILEAIGGKRGSILDTFGTGAELLRDNEEIHVLNKRGWDNEVVIEYRKNLTGFELEEDTTDLVTRIYPFATYQDEEGKDITLKGDVIDSPLIDKYSHPFIKAIDYSDKFQDGDIPTIAKLTAYANNEYKTNKVDIPKQNFKIEFIPLSKCVGYNDLEDNISLCDTVTIKDTRYNIDTQAKVIKTIFNVLKNRYEAIELGEPKTTLGDIVGGGDGDKPEVGPPGPPGPPGEDGNIGDFPDTVPVKSVLVGKQVGLTGIDLTWTFENKIYYTYELYASKVKDFKPNIFDRVFAGQASTFVFDGNCGETWYFRVCAVNTHGNRSELSDQVSVYLKKTDEFANYFDELAVRNLVADIFSAKYMEANVIKGNWIDAKQLSVTDGNGKRTLDIDSFGNINLDVASLKISAKDVITEENVDSTVNEALKDVLEKIDTEIGEVNNSLSDMGSYLENAFKDGILSEQEKEVLKTQLLALNSEKDDVIAQVEGLAKATELAGTSELTSLNSSKSSYITAHNALVAEMNKIIGGA